MADAFEEFGPYVVYERLGLGGMATVHRAEKRGVGIRRPIALKRLLPHVAADPALVKLFVDEARLASHLHHANVAQTYELGKVGNTFFIAMEYASGPTLAQIIRQCQHTAAELPLTITVNILQQVCEALDYAHNLCDETGRSLRVIHRDVSPANVIVTNSGIVKLIDFGIAKATISSTKTQTGFIKGKFGYIAPEYITGQIDARVDLFAVGVVAHEMLSGRRLFEGKDDFETLQNIREMNLMPPSQWNRRVQPDLDDIVMTALQRDPAQRWQSAGAMQTALANAARGLGFVVGSQQLAEWVEWAFSRRQPGTRRAAGATGSAASAAGAAGSEEGFGGATDADAESFGGGPDADSSLSIEVSRPSSSALDGALPAELTAGRDSQPEIEPTPTPHTQLTPPPVAEPDPDLELEPELEPETLTGAEPEGAEPEGATEIEGEPFEAEPQRPTPQTRVAPPPRAILEASKREPDPRRAPDPRPAARRAPSPAERPGPRRAQTERLALRSAPDGAERPTPQTQVTPPPEPMGRSRRPRLPSDSDETMPLDRIALSTQDIELLTPSPELAPPPMLSVAGSPPAHPAMPFTMPRASRTHEAVGSSPPVPVAVPVPPLAHPRPSRPFDAVSPLRAPSPPRLSSPFDAVPSPSRPSSPSSPFDAIARPTPPPRASRPTLPFATPPTPPPLTGAATPPHATGLAAALGSPYAPSPQELELLGTPPQVAASQELEVLRRPAAAAAARPSREHAVPALPPGPAAHGGPPAALDDAAPRPQAKPKPRRRQGATPAARIDFDTAPVARRGGRSSRPLWLLLLMLALGGGAMAAAYYWPDLF